MHKTTNDVRYTPRKVSIITQPLSVSSFDSNTNIVDNNSANSSERIPPLRKSTTSVSNIKIVRSYQQNPNDIVSTPNKFTSTCGCKSMKRFLLGTAVIVILSVIIVVPTVVTVVLSRNTTVISIKTTMTTITTTLPTITTSVSWHFDNNANDLSNTYNGILVNNATYINASYFGYGAALQLTSSLNSSVIITSPFFNLSHSSFTVESWIYLSTITGDNPIFSQCECVGCQRRCLLLAVQSGKLYMTFTPNVLTGATALSINTWYHVAYVYDHTDREESIYVQGILDGVMTPSNVYLGDSGAITIGASDLSSNFFNGYIDDLKITTIAKSSDDILSDASLVAYFTFDSSTLTDDKGPNKISAYMQNAAAVTGKVGQALAFSGTLSYFQVYAVYQLSQPNKEFSIALWIYPTAANGTLVQKTRSQYTTSGSCCIYIAFTSAGQIVFSIPISLSNTSQVYGPIISVNQWTHLGYTYSQTNGLIMYINGVKYGTTGSIAYSSTGNSWDWLNVGWSASSCTVVATAISNGYYQGAIDEFYIYRRELSASAIASLANV